MIAKCIALKSQQSFGKVVKYQNMYALCQEFIFFEYPARDHTCRYALVQNVTDSFEGDKLYNKLPEAAQNFVNSHLSEKEFWDYAIILYQSDVPQDKAFEILQQIGTTFTAFFILVAL